ncbi:MAG: DUF433 domain-containing protein [Actinomycetota bacterium]
MWQERITFDTKIVAGKPIIKGTRLSVDFILDLIANDWSYEEIIKNYPQIDLQDIKACLEYASRLIKDEKVLLI